jgi:thymidylate kinase
MVMDVSGIAGAGKTTLLREVVPALRAEGISVLLLAPTAPSEKHLRFRVSRRHDPSEIPDRLGAAARHQPRHGYCSG